MSSAEVVFKDILNHISDLVIAVNSDSFFSAYADTVTAWGKEMTRVYESFFINPVTGVLRSGKLAIDVLAKLCFLENYWHSVLINGTYFTYSK